MVSKGRKFHDLATEIREEGNFGVSLNLHNLSLYSYSQDKDFTGFSEALADMSITYRHMASKLNDDSYLILAKNFAKSAVEIAEQKAPKEALALAYFNLAKAYADLGEKTKAVDYFKKAFDQLQENPPQTHNRPAIKADFQIHYGTALAKSGDDKGIEFIEEGIKLLEAVETTEESVESEEDVESSYNKNVWLSGAYGNLADLLRDSNADRAREALQKAKEIIDSDKRLKLRLGQWEKLAESFK